jgi:hypothetical protein
MQNNPRLFGVLFKASVLLVVFNFAFILFVDLPLGKFTLYNTIFKGRARFPFGETRESYNLSLFDLDAMFASHILAGTEKTDTEYRVFLIGDSSVWGTLLTPEQTLAGQLNAKGLNACDKTVRVYNLGYPTISLTKDLMIIDQAQAYEPDLIIWLTTLEAFPEQRQFESPLVANNAERVAQLIRTYELNASINDPALIRRSQLDQAFVSQRRALADLIRLQLYGVLWSSTGIDQIYPTDYERAQIDLSADQDFHGLTTPAELRDALAIDVLDAGMRAVPVPTLLVNEPMLISNGLNSDVRYNFFYPRWAYDTYRDQITELAARQAWHYLDLWDLVPAAEFTNSAIHLTPAGESQLADSIAQTIPTLCK